MSDKDLLVNRFVSVPKDLGDLNCGAFAAGMVRGILRSAGFPAKVSAYYSESGRVTAGSKDDEYLDEFPKVTSSNESVD